MHDTECVEFLRWALPQMQLRWQGFRKVRGGVCKRISRRMKELDLTDTRAYRDYLAMHSEEWTVFKGLCRVSISRFYRDRDVFQTLAEEAFPRLIEQARADTPPPQKAVIRCWSAGCASGEEAYTLSLIWNLCLQRDRDGFRLEIIATDADPHLIDRCRKGTYQHSSLRALPDEWVEAAFDRVDGEFRIKNEFREDIFFLNQDLLAETPPGEFNLILCRNSAFTYWNQNLQNMALARLEKKLIPSGFLVIGKQESLPDTESSLLSWRHAQRIFQKASVISPSKRPRESQ